MAMHWVNSPDRLDQAFVGVGMGATDYSPWRTRCHSTSWAPALDVRGAMILMLSIDSHRAMGKTYWDRDQAGSDRRLKPLL